MRRLLIISVALLMGMTVRAQERLFTIECLPSIRGHVVIVHDTIGYGVTKDEAIPLLQSGNIARVAVDMRLAVQEYFAAVGEKRSLPRKLPRPSSTFLC